MSAVFFENRKQNFVFANGENSFATLRLPPGFGRMPGEA
jgi:hypothetical protein